MRNAKDISIMIMLLLSVCLISACLSQEKRDARLVHKFSEAIQTNDIDKTIKYRKKVMRLKSRAVPHLLRELTKTDSGSVKTELLHVLEKSGDDGIVTMVQLLSTEEKIVQDEILKTIEYLKNPAVLKPLESFLTTLDRSDPLFFASSRALVIFGSEKGYTALNELLLSGSDQVRLEIALLYSELSNEKALPALLAALKKEKDGEIKMYVIDGLGKLKLPRTVPYIRKYGLHDKRSYLVRKAAAKALTLITGESHTYFHEDGRRVYPD